MVFLLHLFGWLTFGSKNLSGSRLTSQEDASFDRLFFRRYQDCFTSKNCNFKAWTISPQDCTSPCEGDVRKYFVCYLVTLFRITKMIIGLIFAVDFDRISATQLKIAFVEFTGVVEKFLFNQPSKLIVKLLRESATFTRLIGSRLGKNAPCFTATFI